MRRSLGLQLEGGRVANILWFCSVAGSGGALVGLVVGREVGKVVLAGRLGGSRFCLLAPLVLPLAAQAPACSLQALNVQIFG